MSALTDRKVLFFLAGSIATVPELAAIEAIIGRVQVRTGLIPSAYGAALEPCDAVAGTVPAAYSALPLAQTAGVAVASGAVIPVQNSVGADAHSGTAVVAGNALGAVKITAATTAIVDNADVVSVRNSAGVGGQNGAAVAAAGVLTGVNLPATVAMVASTVKVTVAITGTIGTGITFTVVNGVITAGVLS